MTPSRSPARVGRAHARARWLSEEAGRDRRDLENQCQSHCYWQHTTWGMDARSSCSSCYVSRHERRRNPELGARTFMHQSYVCRTELDLWVPPIPMRPCQSAA